MKRAEITKVPLKIIFSKPRLLKEVVEFPHPFAKPVPFDWISTIKVKETDKTIWAIKRNDFMIVGLYYT